MTELYLLQNKTAGYLGNSPVFWAEKGGYTQWIDDAKHFTKDEAKKIIRETEGSHQWEMWQLDFIQQHARKTVDMQALLRNRINHND